MFTSGRHENHLFCVWKLHKLEPTSMSFVFLIEKLERKLKILVFVAMRLKLLMIKNCDFETDNNLSTRFQAMQFIGNFN